jgi:hypothetical protein
MKSRLKMTKSLFVIAIAMCLNISVISPLFAFRIKMLHLGADTKEECISDTNWWISTCKDIEVVGICIGGGLAGLVAPAPALALKIGLIIGGTGTVAGAKICVSHEEYKKNEICPKYPSENSTSTAMPPQLSSNKIYQWLSENAPNLITGGNITHLIIKRPPGFDPRNRDL